MDASAIVDVDEPVGTLRLDDRVDSLRGVGELRLASNEREFDMERLLTRFADHETASSIGRVGGLHADVLRAWEHSLVAGDPAGANRLVVLARAIRAVDSRHGAAMIG